MLKPGFSLWTYLVINYILITWIQQQVQCDTGSSWTWAFCYITLEMTRTLKSYVAWCPGPLVVLLSSFVAASAGALWKQNNYHWSLEATAEVNFIKHLLIHNWIRILPGTIQTVKRKISSWLLPGLVNSKVLSEYFLFSYS